LKRLLVIALAAAAAFAVVQADVADAARIGGSRSFGMQRSIAPPAPRTAPSTGSMTGPAANPVMPAKPGSTLTRPAAAPTPAAVQPSGASRWLAPLAGVAAGLGLAALVSHLGLSEGFGSLLLVGLLVVAGIALVRAFAARRVPAPQYAGDASTTVRTSLDARREPSIGSAWGSGDLVATSGAGRYPPGFDPAPFVAQAKQQFRRLQAAYDRGDRALLADVTTPEMQAEIMRDLDARRAEGPTEVITLDADVVEVVQEGDRYVASVRYHGTLREDGNAPQPFDELWHLVKPVDGSTGWLLAGIQQYA
jgi:predicted lipid-binding transport protein (Tim44 family)